MSVFLDPRGADATATAPPRTSSPISRSLDAQIADAERLLATLKRMRAELPFPNPEVK